jgi:hypothetical protein
MDLGTLIGDTPTVAARESTHLEVKSRLRLRPAQTPSRPEAIPGFVRRCAVAHEVEQLGTALDGHRHRVENLETLDRGVAFVGEVHGAILGCTYGLRRWHRTERHRPMSAVDAELGASRALV